MNICSIEGCDKPLYARGLCQMHYARDRKSKPIKICSIDGCNGALYARGWCEMHYARWQRKGDTSKADVGVQLKRDEIIARFESNTDKTETCWIWTGSINSAGYGTVSLNGESHLVHRLSWDLFRSEPIGSKFVLHICDVKTCVNPSHLFSGSQAENIADMIRKGRKRNAGAKGTKHHRCKLTEQDVRLIRDSGQKWADIAKQFEISVGNVAMIRSRKSWRHLP